MFENYLSKKEKEVPKPLEFNLDKYTLNQAYKNGKSNVPIQPSKSTSFTNSNTTTSASSNNVQTPNIISFQTNR